VRLEEELIVGVFLCHLGFVFPLSRRGRIDGEGGVRGEFVELFVEQDRRSVRCDDGDDPYGILITTPAGPDRIKLGFDHLLVVVIRDRHHEGMRWTRGYLAEKFGYQCVVPARHSLDQSCGQSCGGSDGRSIRGGGWRGSSRYRLLVCFLIEIEDDLLVLLGSDKGAEEDETDE